MADLGSEIRTYLLTNSGVTDLVSTRIRPDNLAQGDSVSSGGILVYTIINSLHDHMINGLAGIARSRVEFTAYASARLAANAVAEAVRVAGLVGYVGLLGSIQVESVMIDSGVQYLEEPPTDGSQEHRYLTVFDYVFTYQESA